jgi:hypothetical protein
LASAKPHATKLQSRKGMLQRKTFLPDKNEKNLAIPIKSFPYFIFKQEKLPWTK